MNLRMMANSATQLVNPNDSVDWLQATGYTTDAAKKRTPTYDTFTFDANIQAVSGEDLRHIDALSQQGIMRTVYVYGNVQGIVRPDSKGGDLLKFPQRPGDPVQTWLVVKVKETWRDWASVVVALQQ